MRTPRTFIQRVRAKWPPGWFNDREMEALRIVEKHCSRWSQERKDCLREDIERAMHDFASEIAHDVEDHYHD